MQCVPSIVLNPRPGGATGAVTRSYRLSAG